MENALILARQTAVMFALILFGAFLYKKGIFTKEGGRQLSGFLISAVCPVLIFMSFQKKTEERLISGLASAFLMAFAAHIIFIIINTLFFRGKNRGEDYRVERFAATYSNCAFLGIPLAEALYGSDGVFYITAFIAVYNLFAFTHGVILMTEKTDFQSMLHIVKTPAVIAVFAGAVCFFAGIILPEQVLEPLNYIASLNTPLAMIVSGITIAQSDLLKAVRRPGVYITSAFKLIICPLAAVLAFIPFRNQPEVVNTMLVAAAAPTGAVTVMLAGKYGRNDVYASEIFAVTTLLSVVTVPLVLAAAEILFQQEM